ncbi:hypothetical protein IW148_003825 [Coemansia sp. RSA 1199]|nr:hypothetical protein IW148_003825 [Coemansia sp. RSA 1199]
MAGEKRSLQQAQSAEALPLASTPGPTHSMFLNLRLEPFITSSLIEILDILAHPVSISASVPSTPPPIYEPPPPSYSSPDTFSMASMSSLDLGRPATSLFVDTDGDAISIITIDSCGYGDSLLDRRDTSSSRSSIYSYGIASNNITGSSLAPRLQNELVLSVIMYEFLSHRPTLSRSPSRDTVMTSG